MPSTRFLFVLLALSTLPVPAPAEDSASLAYDFGKRLLHKGSEAFPIDDLAERYIAKLEAQPATRLAALLLKVESKRSASHTARFSAERRNQLLTEAQQLLVQAAGPELEKSSLKEAFEEARARLPQELVVASLGEADELEPKHPEEARQKRAEAGTRLEKLAAPLQESADARKAEFEKLYTQFTKESDSEQNAQRIKNGQEPLYTPELLAKLSRAYAQFIATDERYIQMRVHQMDCYPDADAGKKTLGAALLTRCQERLDHESTANFPVVEATYLYLKGKVYASLGQEEQAYAAWKEALAIGATETPLEK